MRFALLATCLSCLLAAQDPAADPAKDSHGSIEGTVLNAATGAPLRKAQVELRPVSSAPELPESRSMVSDAGGNFSFAGLAPGTYFLSVSLNGFARSRQTSKPITLEKGAKQTGLSLKLTPQGVITGRVTDQDGDPLVGATVQVMRRVYQNGKRDLAPSGGTNTNDRGEYRLYGLVPGKYFLSAQYRGSGLQFINDSYPAVFYPNARAADTAAVLNVAPGAELQGMDLALSKGKAVRLRGVVLDVNDRPLPNVFVRLLPSQAGDSFSHTSVRANEKGVFALPSVSPGSYTLRADTMEEVRMLGLVSVDVGETNIDGVTVRMEPAHSIAGRIVVEGKPEFALPTINLNLEPRSGGFGGVGATTKPDGSFTLSGVGRDVFKVNAFTARANLYLKSVRVGDQDISETGLDFTQGVLAGDLTITLSDAGAEVSGTVQDDQGNPAPSATVVLVPDPPKRTQARLFKITLTDLRGNFTLKGIAPGDYKLFAWDDLEPGAQLDPDFLKPFETQGETVSVKENSRESRQLKLIHNTVE